MMVSQNKCGNIKSHCYETYCKCLYLLFKNLIWFCWLWSICFLVYLLNGHLVNCIMVEWDLISTEYCKIFAKNFICLVHSLSAFYSCTLHEYLWGLVIIYQYSPTCMVLTYMTFTLTQFHVKFLNWILWTRQTIMQVVVLQ
jgi:hypothetical protein